MKIKMLLTLTNLILTQIKSLSMFSTNKDKLGDISLGISEIGIIKRVLLVESKDTR